MPADDITNRPHHGHTRQRHQTPEYTAWINMKGRCSDNPDDPDYPFYGGRGITVCDKWRDSFEAFLADMGARPGPEYSIDRWPNNDGNYEPSNCRWATRNDQQRNSRNARLITHDGQTYSVAEWAERIGVKAKTLAMRLGKGWEPSRALNPKVGRWVA